ncbi:MAG: DUF4167 domain-containing protein [Rhodospirillales bacterium]|nr:DUF4167 domain-containing protein [Rhodospirillales bacterium]MCW8951894.1 DUF4167 domain-containing protein [Rhodospirillales bacterium]MCW8969752.1 DUF4167 domain-containing protein [Rhodospirillales bacterium]MCW9002152.1 DUF4167 domain-containing protein [Rhodospirillales bacterium]MCW9040629.1 DUF4167 domain-containing protein [Rhodospirillales bacterium]
MKNRTADTMAKSSNPKRPRPRSRGNGKRPSHRPNNVVDSSGPEVKIRGSAQQVLDKYLSLARDATTSGDRVRAENYFQHADHYYRVLHANGGPRPQQQEGGQGNPAGNTESPSDDNQDGDGGDAETVVVEHANQTQSAPEGDDAADDAEAGEPEALSA